MLCHFIALKHVAQAVLTDCPSDWLILRQKDCISWQQHWVEDFRIKASWFEFFSPVLYPEQAPSPKYSC